MCKIRHEFTVYELWNLYTHETHQFFADICEGKITKSDCVYRFGTYNIFHSTIAFSFREAGLLDTIKPIKSANTGASQ